MKLFNRRAPPDIDKLPLNFKDKPNHEYKLIKLVQVSKEWMDGWNPVAKKPESDGNMLVFVERKIRARK